MKENIFKFMGMVLAFVMILSFGTTVFAAENEPIIDDIQFFTWQDIPDLIVNEDTLSKSNEYIVRSNSAYLIAEYEKMQEMSIDELNSYIDNICFDSNVTERSARKKRMIVPNTNIALKAAWLAAAQAAKLAGYPCAAKAVEYSVLGLDYTENNGIFAEKIKTTYVFKRFLSLTKKRKTNYIKKGKIFKKTDNSDLFYALHKVDITLKKSGSSYKVNIYDVFDFDIDNKYKSLFTSTVNNWAWLCQNMGALNKIKININFTS